MFDRLTLKPQLLLPIFLVLSTALHAQKDSISSVIDSVKTAARQDTLPPSYWKVRNSAGLNVSEVAFVNWNAGGSNSISGLGEAKLTRNYKKENLKWRNKFESRFGINKQEGQSLRKTDDYWEVSTTFGYRRDTTSQWYYTAKSSLVSQYATGFNYPDREEAISRFMAPGYLFFGLGSEYGKEIENLLIYLSPLTYKATFVLDQELANEGAFGVEPAVLDFEGNVITPGDRVRSELGILINSSFSASIAENIAMTNAISLYTDYLNSFGNIDVDWEVNFNFKVNSFVLAKLGSHLRYDNDVKLTETNEAGETIELGARTQWKQQLGIGVIYEF